MNMSKRTRWPTTLALITALASLATTADQPDAILVDGGRYYGPLVDGQLHGTGRLEWANGGYYEGEFRYGLKQGEGRKVIPEVTLYVGQFRDGLPHGQGRVEWVEGSHYEGEFARGLPQGEGTHTTPRGSKYTGQFRRGKIVTGIWTDPNGTRYEGAFKEWTPHGEGVFHDSYGGIYSGTFDEGVFSGEGSYRDENVHYQGEFQGWRYHGQGRIEYASGDIWEGEFVYGQRHGEGRLTPADGGDVIEGHWQWDRLVDGDDRAEDRAAIRQRVEELLYNQHELLATAFAQLTPSEPDRPNLYLFAIGSYGAEEVFRREVEFVVNLFDRRFATAGRSLALVNSRNTHQKYPMATATSIDMALAALSEHMDAEQDILFVFLTSHGSRDHKLSIAQNGMQLPDLSAQSLAAKLDAAPVPWQVVVVSACYAGGFIEPLASDTRMVITAADADSRSFGCSDEADMTYFGRAFFEQALNDTRDFAVAFHRAVELVTEREAEEGYEDQHSNPQMHAPAALMAQLARWRAHLPDNE